MKQYEVWIKGHLKSGTLTGWTIIFIVTTILERYFLVSADMNPARDHYISSTLLAITAFIVALKGIGLFGGSRRIAGVLSSIGRNYSTWIYIIHPIFLMILATIASKVGAYNIYQFIAPIVVYLVTTVFVACVLEIRKRIIKVVEN